MAYKPAPKAKTAAAPKTAAKKPGQPVITAAKRPAPKAARKAAPKKAAETVTLKTVFEQLADGHGMPKKQAHAMAAELVDVMTGIPEERRSGAHERLGHHRGEGSPGAHGTQPGHRRGNPDCRQQEGGFPRCQGAEGGSLRQACRRSAAGHR
jgi:hypothetical protein